MFTLADIHASRVTYASPFLLSVYHVHLSFDFFSRECVGIKSSRPVPPQPTQHPTRNTNRSEGREKTSALERICSTRTSSQRNGVCIPRPHRKNRTRKGGGQMSKSICLPKRVKNACYPVPSPGPESFFPPPSPPRELSQPLLP